MAAPATQPVTEPSAAAGVRNPGPLLPTDRPITLDEAIAVAYRNRADILIAQESLEAARQRVTQARAGTRPSVIGSVSFTERGVTDFGDIFGPGDSPNLSDEIASPQVAARQTIYDQGQTRLAVRQARSGVLGASAGVESAYVNLGFLVTNDFFNLLRARAVLALADEQVRLAQQQLDLVEARIEAGTAARSDRAPVLTELRLAQERRIRAQNEVRQSGSQLRNSMGLPAGQPPDVIYEAPGDFTIPTYAESLTEAYRRRPEIRQDQASVEIAEASLQLARIQRRPVLTTIAGLNVTPVERESRGDWSLFAGVTMPIWDAGVTRSRQQEASANLGSASVRLEQTRKDVAAEVEQAVYSLASARERVDASEASVEAATVALEAANARFEVGLAIIVEITDAQLDYITAQNSRITALYDFFIARAQLDRAIGRYRGGNGG
jgi:outer membrane protein TolC